MQKVAKKLISKYIIKILKIFQNTIEHDRFNFKNYLEQTIFFEIDYLIRLVKEKNKEEQKDGKYKKKFSRSK